jgi:hypothetical protein
MQSEFRAALVHLCRRVLRPLVRILVRYGISAGELKSIIDAAYAHAAAEYLEQQGERVTYSRLAVITGIKRSAQPEILNAPEGDDFRPRSTTQLHRAARVLNGWHEDRAFQTRAGKPAVLPIHGERHSFQQLVHWYSGGMYYQTILSELERLGAVKRVGAESVRAVRRSLNADGPSTEALYGAGEVAGDLMATLDRNLAAAPHEQLPVRSLVLDADARSLPLFRAQAARRADALVEQFDSFLHAHPPTQAAGRRAAGADQPGHLPMGVAVFAICREPDPVTPKPPGRARPKRRGRSS